MIKLIIIIKSLLQIKRAWKKGGLENRGHSTQQKERDAHKWFLRGRRVIRFNQPQDDGRASDKELNVPIISNICALILF